jgi:predicted DNA-binding transcriptional regulator AlpA
LRKSSKAKKTKSGERKRHREAPIKPGARLLFKPQVLELLGGLAYSTLWEWMKDGAFPLPLELGPSGGRSSTIAWDANEVFGWLANRPRRQLGQHEFRGRDAPKRVVAHMAVQADAVEKQAAPALPQHVRRKAPPERQALRAAR